MADNSVLYTAVYTDLEDAKFDLQAFEQVHKDHMIGKFDAAVIDKEDGKPHIVKRVDHPYYRVIPEWFGSGTLPRKELHEAAQALDAGRPRWSWSANRLSRRGSKGRSSDPPRPSSTI